jgi:hypothetical protein
MARIDWDLQKYDGEFKAAGMKRIEAAAGVIRDDARRILNGKLKGNWKEHGPYSHMRKGHKLVDFEASIWTERTKAAMVSSIRVTRREGEENVWVIAGNFKTWWATQLEFGRGRWKGGAKPFLRPAMLGAESKIHGILEGGAIGQEEI